MGGIDSDGRHKEESESSRRQGMSQQEQEIGERLRQWRREHPHATFDEIDAEAARQYV